MGVTKTGRPSGALTTGDLARRTGTTLRTVRFYEEAGLLRPTVREEGGRRRYLEDDVARLEFISDLRELGLSLDDIRRMLDIKKNSKTPRELAAKLSAALEDQLERATKRISALRKLKEELTDSLSRVESSCGNGCTRELAHDACSTCHVAHDEAPRLLQVVLGRRKPCSGLFQLGRPKTNA